MILGQGVAKKLGVQVGDFINLMIPSATSGDKVQAPKRVSVKVSGLLALNGQIDHSIALLPLEDAKAYAHLGSGNTGISIKVADVLQTTQIVRDVSNQLSEYVYLHSWQQKYGFVSRYSVGAHHYVFSNGTGDWGREV